MTFRLAKSGIWRRLAYNTSRDWAAADPKGAGILGGRKVIYVRIVLAAIFDFMTEEDWGE